MGKDYADDHEKYYQRLLHHAKSGRLLTQDIKGRSVAHIELMVYNDPNDSAISLLRKAMAVLVSQKNNPSTPAPRKTETEVAGIINRFKSVFEGTRSQGMVIVTRKHSDKQSI